MAEHENQSNDVHPDREQLFGNEAFAIGMLQVVSGGSIVAGISQFSEILDVIGKAPFLVFISGMAAALLCAVLAAYWRHQYKMWDVKRRPDFAGCNLRAMRQAMLGSVILVSGSITWLTVSMWFTEYCK